jgi:cytochrome P450
MATTLINTFHNLARYPTYQQQIRSELKRIPSVSDFVAIQELPILNSVIKETLRLWPPVPTGSGRKVPAGGLTIAGQYIPAETVIFAPRYTIARSEWVFGRLGTQTR